MTPTRYQSVQEYPVARALFQPKVLKLCDGAITHVSTVAGGSLAEDDERATQAEDGPGSDDVGVDSAAGAAMYVVTAGEDGAVRFYDLKFRLEVRVRFGR